MSSETYKDKKDCFRKCWAERQGAGGGFRPRSDGTMAGSQALEEVGRLGDMFLQTLGICDFLSKVPPSTPTMGGSRFPTPKPP